MPSLVPLSPDDCRDHLAANHFGRLAFVDDTGPIALPLNYAWDGTGVVFRSTEGGKLHAAVANDRAAFEIDDVDPMYHRGWSVVVRGRLEVVEAAGQADEFETLRLTPWWPAARDRWMRLHPDEITGRRIAP